MKNLRSRSVLLPFALTAALVAGCGAADGDDPGREPVGDTPVEDGTDDTTDGIEPDAEPTGEETAPDEGDLGDAEPPVDEEIEVEFDEAAATARAEELLGTAEEDLPTDDPDVRVMRRGDEDMMGTMDLRPGRANLTLDDDGSGTFVVTRIEVETPDGEPIVVE